MLHKKAKKVEDLIRLAMEATNKYESKLALQLAYEICQKQGIAVSLPPKHQDNTVHHQKKTVIQRYRHTEQIIEKYRKKTKTEVSLKLVL